MKTITLNKKLFKLLLFTVAIFASGSLLAQSVTITSPAAASTTIMTGSSLSFTGDRSGSFTGSGNYTWTWAASPSTGVSFTNNPNSTTSDPVNTTATFANPGTYTVTVTVSRGTTTVVSAAKTVVVVGPPPPAQPITNCNSNNCTVINNSCQEGQFSASFVNGTYQNGSAANSLAQGAIWRFVNVANINGVQINATVRVDTLFQAQLMTLDDDAALDENNQQTLQSFLSPNIRPDVTLNQTTRRGHVQFTISFWEHQDNPVSDNDFQVPASLLGVNYSHYDIDGVNSVSGGNGYYFRETGHAEEYPGLAVTANANTELTAYNYFTGDKSWKGYAGTICNRTSTSRCVQAIASFKYSSISAISAITVRMGYDYQKVGNTTNGYNSQPTRLYASKFECFSFPEEIILPVKLLSFAGSFRNQATTLNWETADEVNFEGFQVERSSDGSSFAPVASLAARGTSGSSKQQYQHIDDLSAVNGTVFYYRLRMNDLDGKYKYSNVVMIRKEQKSINGITLNPNPVISGGMANVRFSAAGTANVEFRVVDMAGKVLLKQQSKVYEGNNSVSINNLDRLQPGMYMLQLANGNELTAVKFTIVR